MSALTAMPAAPGSMVITTDFTSGPKPKAPMTPKATEMSAER